MFEARLLPVDERLDAGSLFRVSGAATALSTSRRAGTVRDDVLEVMHARETVSEHFGLVRSF